MGIMQLFDLFVGLVVALLCLGMYEGCGEMWLCGG